MLEAISSDLFLRLVSLADSEAVPLWSGDEIADVWRHQLRALLVRCIQELGPVHAIRCETLCAELDPPVRTLQELIRHPKPNVELLSLVARWVERALGEVDEVLPRDVALCIFNLLIVLARTRCSTKLIAGQDIELARRAEWVAARPWLDAPTRAVMQRAIAELGGTDSQEMR